MEADWVISFPGSTSRAMRILTLRLTLLRVLRAGALPDDAVLRAAVFRPALLRAGPLRAGPLRAAPFLAAVLRAALRPAPLAARVLPVRRAAPLEPRAVFLACFVEARVRCGFLPFVFAAFFLAISCLLVIRVKCRRMGDMCLPPAALQGKLRDRGAS